MASKVKSVNLLPGYLQTDKNSKFLSSTLDQLIQPAELSRIDGFIGSKLTPTYVSTTDNYISDGFLSMYIKKDFRGTIERGTPLAQIIPFKRDSYEMSLAGPEEANILLSKQRFLVRSKFSNFYRNHMRQRKDYK
jgi:hypothetical protein